MADQLNARWPGYAGNSLVDTPHIDSIAEQGTVFTKAVCNSPVCAPSRISLAGGLYPHRLGALDNYTLYPIGYRRTYYERLRSAGYRVGVAGKTDLHKADHYNGIRGDTPFMYQLGFTDSVDVEGKMHSAKTLDFRWNPHLPKPGTRDPLGAYQEFLTEHGTMERHAADYFDRLMNRPVWYSKPSPLPEEQYIDGFIGDKAHAFLETVTPESPWHLFISFDGPHDPWDAPQRYFDRYAEKSFPPMPSVSAAGKPRWIRKRQEAHSKGMTEEDFNKVRSHYAGMIKYIDDQVGEILAVLKQRGMEEETIIIFCSDHGEMMGSHGLFQKRVMYEDSVRIPLVICDPDYNHHRKSPALADLVDLYPTILDLAGVDYNADELDGRSLAPLLGEDGASKDAGHKPCQISEIVECAMVFDGRYKYIENINDTSELYDLDSDPGETDNLVESDKKRAKQLKWALKNELAGIR